MIRLTRIVPFAFSLAAGFAATGCRSYSPLPLPDASPLSGLSLSATPNSLDIRPGSSGRVRFLLRDASSLPVPDYPLTFAFQDDGSGYGTANARLSSAQGLTDGNGMAELEVIVGNLDGDSQQATFFVSATCPGSTESLAEIVVTTSTYAVEILPVPSLELLGSISIVSTKLQLFDDTTCGDLDLTNLNAAPTRPRTPQHPVPANSSFVFTGVAASSTHAVVGLGLDGLDNTASIQIGGCIDIPGTSLLASETIRATLLMDRLFPVPLGTFQVASDFKLTPPPSALAGVQGTWQQWARCPLDPARLWLDCTLDALATNETSDPLDCVPVPGAEGALGDLLFPRRGTVVPSVSGISASSSDPPCRAQTDSAGNESLENIVDNLFSSTRGQLQGARLGALSDEIAALLGEVRIASRMTIAAASDVNSYSVEHELLVLTFPNAPALVSLAIPILGLPVSSVTGILATLKGGQLTIPTHGFTLRLGTSARYAFEATSLKSRDAQDSPSLVKAILGLAQWSDQGTILSGCSALDAAVCDQVQQTRGCLMSACQTGLDALAVKLAGAFDSLDGRALDFLLSGVSPVVDSNGDGQADALGLGGRAGSPSVTPGLWSAMLDTQGGNYFAGGSWTATRVTKSP